MRPIIIAGIGTGIGKTILSAIVAEALEADYWKPVQAGNLDFTDSDTVRSLVSNAKTKIIPETYRLKHPASPHDAAAREGIKIDSEKIRLPENHNAVVIELAGGLMVPLNDKSLNTDLVKKLNSPVILLSQNYLGSINHTLLSVSACKNSGIDILGIVFNGEPNKASEEFIVKYTGLDVIGKIPMTKVPDGEWIRQQAVIFRPKLEKLIAPAKII